MNRITDFLFGHLRLSQEEREHTRSIRAEVMAQRTQAEYMAEKIQVMQDRNHFGERIRRAFEAGN